MEFKLNIELNPADFNIQHGDEIVLLGSCFSDSMQSHFEKSGFNVVSNPFGTLFHPIALESIIHQSLNDKTEVNVLERDGLFYSWGASSKLFGESNEKLRQKILTERICLKKNLLKAKLLIITFGSAWGYSYETLGTVANCHKMPSSLFSKELTSLEEMLEVWMPILEELKRLNPELSVVFTVSPVRHKKDGMVNNNRSKGRLIELSHLLTASVGTYFPSYEIVIDELRDYRFYKKDLVHPSDDAICYVWEKLKKFIFNTETMDLIKQIENVNSTLAHRSLHPNHKSDIDRIEKTNTAKAQLSEKYQGIYWK